MEKTIHQGRNVARFRQMLGMKQDFLATAMGGDWTQKKVSLLEAKEEIDQELLEEVAKALKIPAEAIKHFDEEAAYNVIGNTVTTVNDNATGQLFQFNPIINPIDKWVDALEENKRLYAALLKEKDEKIALLEKLL